MIQVKSNRVASKFTDVPVGMICLVLLLILVLPAREVAASTYCDVRYQFLGYTKESSDIFWIGAQLEGDCYGAKILSISITDSGCIVVPTALPYETNFSPVSVVLGTFKHGTYVGHGVIKDWIEFSDSCSISSTQRTTSMADSLERLHQATQIMDGRYWNKNHGVSGIELPQCTRCRLQLLAYDINGLYVDYEFDRVFTFQPDPYVLIFTRQKRIGDGGDQMHGYLLFRVIR